jgi:hypothetical protein
LRVSQLAKALLNLVLMDLLVPFGCKPVPVAPVRPALRLVLMARRLVASCDFTLRYATGLACGKSKNSFLLFLSNWHHFDISSFDFGIKLKKIPKP